MSFDGSIQYNLNYQQVNQLLSRNDNSQQLYKYLINQKTGPSQHNLLSELCKSGNKQKHAELMLLLNGNFESSDCQLDDESILKKAQKQIINEVTKLTRQIYKLEKQYEQISLNSQQEKKILQLISQNDQKLCDQAWRQQQLMIQDRQIESIKIQTQALAKKIGYFKMIEDGIQGILSEQKQRQDLLTTQKNKLMKKLNSKNIAQISKQELTNDVDSLKLKLEQYKQQKKKEVSEEEHIMACLEQRKQLQEYIAQQQQEKIQFSQLLISFKQKYKATKQTNQRLKQQLRKEGKDLPNIETSQLNTNQ